MKNLKKTVITTIVASAVILSVASCGGNKPAATTTAASTTAATTTTAADTSAADTTEAETEATEETGEDEPDTEGAEFDIVGKTFAGYDVTDEGVSENVAEYYTFNEDGSGSVDGPDGTDIPFNYELDGANVTFHLGSADDNTAGELEYDSEGNLYLTMNYAEKTAVMLLKEGAADKDDVVSEGGAVDTEAAIAAMNKLDPLLGKLSATFSQPPFTFTYEATANDATVLMTMAIGGEYQAYVNTLTTAADGTQQAIAVLYDGADMYMMDPVGKTATKIVGSAENTKANIAQSNMFNFGDVSAYTASRETVEIDGAEFTAVTMSKDDMATIFYFNADEELKYLEANGVRGTVLEIGSDVDPSVFQIPEDYTVTEFSADAQTGESAE